MLLLGTYGAGITLVASNEDMSRLKDIERKCNTRILPLPGQSYTATWVIAEPVIHCEMGYCRTSQTLRHGLLPNQSDRIAVNAKPF